jgi:hypothetical protein
MTDQQPIRDRAKVQFPGIAVSRDVPAVHGQPPISPPSGLPEVPASARLENVTPEAVLQRPISTLVPAWLATEPPQPLSPLEWPRTELSAAVLAVRQGGDAHVLDLARGGGQIPDPATGPVVIA